VGISEPKNFKSPEFCKFPQSIFMKFKFFMCLWGLRKCFRLGVIRCITEGVIGRKLQSGNFHQNFWGPGTKIYVSDRKKLGVQKRDRHPLRMQRSVEMVHTRRQEMKNNGVFFVCMFVTLDVQERGPDVRQHIMSLCVDQFQCSFHCFYIKKWASQLSAEISTISLGGATTFN